MLRRWLWVRTKISLLQNKRGEGFCPEEHVALSVNIQRVVSGLEEGCASTHPEPWLPVLTGPDLLLDWKPVCIRC